jgi:hypothetical protein
MLRFKKMSQENTVEDLTRVKKGSNNSGDHNNKDSCFQIYNRIRKLKNKVNIKILESFKKISLNVLNNLA